ncbi:hypothetical protein JM18_002770 [Phytophthora kernoviae]|uniref:Uncharacterized protein n=2 Tax=Phytophthora kernoviae TaxID=325452 RepID=A0A8T0M5J7_9STRA|nr:hypothetical protein G195_007265 [Phytophthora kernoviae 00238/432]KAG2528003.1 hypothetical protein JM16_003107 [Phytophthora kernoviae]KAG2529473.1 hypothetical protein JM18_002770 [Phytophthora kernoviae]
MLETRRKLLNAALSTNMIGFLVGSSIVVLVLSFQGALFWGLSAHNNKRVTASYVACGIHAFIFTIQCVVTTVVVKSKEDVIDTYAAYEYIPDSGYADNVNITNISINASPLGYQATIPTADI